MVCGGWREGRGPQLSKAPEASRKVGTRHFQHPHITFLLCNGYWAAAQMLTDEQLHHA